MSGGRYKVLYSDSATATLSVKSFALSGMPVQRGCLDKRLRSPSTLQSFSAFQFGLFQQLVVIFRSGDDFCKASFTHHAPGFLLFTPLDFEGSHTWLPPPLLVHPLHVISVSSSVMVQSESTSPLLKQAAASIPRHQHILLPTRYSRKLTRTEFTHALQREQLEMLSTHSTHVPSQAEAAALLQELHSSPHTQQQRPRQRAQEDSVPLCHPMKPPPLQLERTACLQPKMGVSPRDARRTHLSCFSVFSHACVHDHISRESLFLSRCLMFEGPPQRFFT